MSYEDRGLKAQMKKAGRAGASYVLILGEEELHKKQVVLRNMINHDQHEITFDYVISAVDSLVG
jgi:histidyl-tRNA synthetase